MRIKRTIKRRRAKRELVTYMGLGELPEGDQVRVGFQKGTLEKATFIMHSGIKITYEKAEEDVTTTEEPVGEDTVQRRDDVGGDISSERPSRSDGKPFRTRTLPTSPRRYTNAF